MTKEYYLYVRGQKVKVSEDIYKVYWREREHEKYLERVDRKNHLLFFSSLDHDGHFVDNIIDETVVKLSQKHIDHSIRVELDLDEFEETPSEQRKKATYKEIKNYVFEKYDVKVTTLAISQIKRKCGLEVGDNYNPPKNEKYRQPQCTPEKEEFIMAALRHFKLID